MIMPDSNQSHSLDPGNDILILASSPDDNLPPPAFAEGALIPDRNEGPNCHFGVKPLFQSLRTPLTYQSGGKSGFPRSSCRLTNGEEKTGGTAVRLYIS